MRLSTISFKRVVSIYLQYDLHFKPGPFEILKYLAGIEDIKASSNTMKRIAKQW